MPSLLCVALLLAGGVNASPYAASEWGKAAPAGTQAASGESKTQDDEPRFELYGFIKLDLAWDSTLVSTGNFIRWVTSRSDIEDDPHFNLTARETRLGLKLRGPSTDTLKTSGQVEIDFYGGGGENKNWIMLRHAYFTMDWPERRLKLLAGQTWDLILPQNPFSLNYTVGWWSGNVGYRRPQLRVSKALEMGEQGTWDLGFAISRTIGDDLVEIETDTGADSSTPTFQARAAYGWPLAGERRASVGLSGHWGREELHDDLRDDVDPDSRDIEFDSWSVGLDWVLPFGEQTLVKGELWTGLNLDDYLGGVAQGVNLARGSEVASTGGWLCAIQPFADRWQAAFAVAIDDPDNGDLEPDARARNLGLWANLVYDFEVPVRIGAELSWWETRYLDRRKGENLRLQGSFIYRF